MLEEFKKWALNHLLLEFSIAKRAPLALIAAVILGLYGGYEISSFRYETSVQNLQSANSQKDATITALRDAIASKPSAIAARDPDGIYQFGVEVGSVVGPYIDDAAGTGQFSSIVGAVKFNAGADFEYRDYKLHIEGFGAETSGMMSGQRYRSLVGVKCKIVGRLTAQ